MDSRKAIDAALINNANAFKQHIENGLNDRASNALHQKRLEISVDSVHVQPEEVEAQPEVEASE